MKLSNGLYLEIVLDPGRISLSQSTGGGPHFVLLAWLYQMAHSRLSLSVQWMNEWTRPYEWVILPILRTGFQKEKTVKILVHSELLEA